MKSQPVEHFVPTVAHWGAYVARVRDGALVALDPHVADSDPSPIGFGIPSSITSAARVRQPMVRKGWLDHFEKTGAARKHLNLRGAEPFVPVSWDEATRLVADVLTATYAAHGAASIFGGSYGWASAGRFHHSLGQLHRFLNLAGGYTSSANSYSKGCIEVTLPHVLGDTLRDRPDVPVWSDIEAHTDLFVAFGGVPLKNTQITPGGMVDHSIQGSMAACKKAGVAFVYVGAVRDDMSDSLGADWVSIRPNTDAAFMLGLAHAIIAEGRADEDFLTRCCVGYDVLRAYILGRDDAVPKSPAWAAEICGCALETIVDLSRRITGGRTLISMLWAVQRGDHGEQPCWLAAALAAMSGSMGKPGGGVGYGYGSVHAYGTDYNRLKIAGFPQGKNPCRSIIPVARLVDALLEPGGVIDYNGRRITYPDIRVVYWAGGNPFHHHQDINRMVRAWQAPETVIVHEPFWTATARHADIVLPATTPLERNDLAGGEGSLMAMHRAIDPVGCSRSDFDILAAIADRLGFCAAFTEGRDEMGWIRHLYDASRANAAAAGLALPAFEAFWAEGTIRLPPTPRPPPVFANLREDPAAHPIATPSGRIELFSETIASFGYDDCPGHGVWIEPAEWLGGDTAKRLPIHLISNQPTTRLHSQHDNGAFSLSRKIKDREPIRLHPADAARRGVADGDVVRVFNDRGAFLAGVVISDDLREHVAQIATGAWYDPLEPGQAGSLEVHGNPNVVTLDKGTSKLAQATSALTCLVEIEKFVGPLPPVKAFDPPPTASRN